MSNKEVDVNQANNEIINNNKPYKSILVKYLYGFLTLSVLLVIMLWLFYRGNGIYSQNLMKISFIIFIISTFIFLGTLIFLMFKDQIVFKSKKYEIFDIAHFVLMIVNIALFIQIFAFTITEVDGSSMEETLHHNDQVIVNQLKINYKNNDIVVFRVDEKYEVDESSFFVKRIKGIPGDKITYKEDKLNDVDILTVYVNEVSVFTLNTEALINNWKLWIDLENNIIPSNKYLLIGDNINSHDSKSFGYVYKEDIKGKVWFRIIRKFGVIK